MPGWGAALAKRGSAGGSLNLSDQQPGRTAATPAGTLPLRHCRIYALQMSKLGKDLIQAADEALAIAGGGLDPKTYRVHIPKDIDVKQIRKSYHLSQSKFAQQFDIPIATLRDWEQKRRRPERLARLLLLMLALERPAVQRVLVALSSTGRKPTGSITAKLPPRKHESIER
jgi:putative transcriptional regulator